MYSLKDVFEQFRIQPHNYSIYEEAITHASYTVNKTNIHNYERLEFLGDSIISKVVSEHLYKKHPDMNEGVMSKTRAIIVQTKTEARAATDLHFNEIIKIGDSVKYSTGIGEKILEDAFEAFVGAVYLDQGEKKVYEILKRTVIHYYEINSLKDLRDFKSLFQELMQKYSKKAIKYRLITDKHSDYEVEVWCNNIKYGEGCGTRIKDAEMQAAKDAYTKCIKKFK